MNEIRKERLHIHSPAACILMLVSFREQIAPERLKSAIARAAARQATLCSRLMQAEDGAATFAPIAEPVVELTVCEEGADEIAAMRDEARTPFEMERGQWLRNRLWLANGRSVWLLAMHHAAGDGMSAIYFIRDVQAALGDESLKWPAEPFTLMRSEDMEGKLSLPLRLGTAAINRKWSKEARTFSAEDRARLCAAYWRGHTLAMERAEISGEALERALTACRERGVTITSAWIAAMLLTGGDSGDVGIAASVRPRGFEGVANWATGVSIRYRPSTDDLWAVAREAQRLMREKLDDANKRCFLLNFLDALSPTLLDAAYYSAFDGLASKPARQISAMFGYGGRPKGYSLTNLTRAPMEAELIERVAFYPPMVPNARRLFGMVTTGGALELTYQSFEPAQDARNFLTGCMAALMGAIA